MKRTWLSIISTLILVFVMSCAFSYFIMPFFKAQMGRRTYSETNCLTEQITDDMQLHDIAKLYRDGNAAVAIQIVGVYANGTYGLPEHGSGVCIASNGYKTALTKEDGSFLQASRGSYIVTNYHVIRLSENTLYDGYELNLITESEEVFPCSILWSNKNLDIAILYCDEVNLNYVTMKDIAIDCSEESRFDIQPIFTIGTPLSIEDYLNRFTEGYIASNDLIEMYTTETVKSKTVLCNLYEDTIDITAGISPGNSGGGCFDENGYLIGLNTLGTDVSYTGGNQMNAVVPIYPAMQIIDRIIENKEADGDNTIFTLENIGLYGIDRFEAAQAKKVIVVNDNTECYYLNGRFYNANVFIEDFNFAKKGYYILENQAANEFSKVGEGTKIVSCKDAAGRSYAIENRNDLIYFLLGVNNGDKITVTIQSEYGFNQTKTIQL